MAGKSVKTKPAAGYISIREASRRYGVPASTLQDWAEAGRVKWKTQDGGPGLGHIVLLERSTLKEALVQYKRDLHHRKEEIVDNLIEYMKEHGDVELSALQAARITGMARNTIWKYLEAGAIRHAVEEQERFRKPQYKIKVSALIKFLQKYDVK